MKCYSLSLVMFILTLFGAESSYAFKTILTPFGLIPNGLIYEEEKGVKNGKKEQHHIVLVEHRDENGNRLPSIFFADSWDSTHIFRYPQSVIDEISALDANDREKGSLFYAFIIIALRGLDNIDSLTTRNEEYIESIQISRESGRFVLTVRFRDSDRTFSAHIYQSEISRTVHGFELKLGSSTIPHHRWRLYYCDGSDSTSLVNVYLPTLLPQLLEAFRYIGNFFGAIFDAYMRERQQEREREERERAQTQMESQTSSCFAGLCSGIKNFLSH